MCRNAIFPFYGALSTMPPNIWQYYTALHEHHYTAQNPSKVQTFILASRAIGSALVTRPRRQGRGLYCSGPQRTQPSRLNRPHLTSFLPQKWGATGLAQPVFFSLSFFGLAHKRSSPGVKPRVLSAQKWHGAYKC